jgi:hypothetical protein
MRAPLASPIAPAKGHSVRRWGLALLAALSIGALGSSAHGAEITFAFTGHVDSVSDPHGILDGSIKPGIQYGGTYKFSSTTPDSRSDAGVGVYRHSSGLYGFTPITLGNYRFAQDPGAQEFYITVLDFADFERYEAVSYSNLPLPGDLAVTEMIWISLLPGGSVFPSDALPLTPPDLAHFPDRTRWHTIVHPSGRGANVFLTTDTLRVVTETPHAHLESIAFTPSVGTGGGTATMMVKLTAPAPAGGATVRIAPNQFLPTGVEIPFAEGVMGLPIEVRLPVVSRPTLFWVTGTKDTPTPEGVARTEKSGSMMVVPPGYRAPIMRSRPGGSRSDPGGVQG